MTGESIVEVRDARVADAETIADVHAASIRGLGSDAYDDRKLRGWLENVHAGQYPIDDPESRVVVAEREGRIVGFGILDLESVEPDTGEITAVYVHPDHARNGIGSVLLERLERTARDAGLETLALTASRNAIGFYERQGYEPLETVSLEMDGGVTLECLRMCKELGR